MTNSQGLPALDLSQLGTGFPALTASAGTSLAEAAAVCLEHQGHTQRVELQVTGSYSEIVAVVRPSVTDQMRRCYADLQEATEFGACGLAILLVRAVVGYTVIERSVKGTGFDYWLGYEDELPFQNKARLEVSGILAGDDGQITTRVKQKREQTTLTDRIALPAYIVVVEFSRPKAQVVTK